MGHLMKKGVGEHEDEGSETFICMVAWVPSSGCEDRCRTHIANSLSHGQLCLTIQFLEPITYGSIQDNALFARVKEISPFASRVSAEATRGTDGVINVDSWENHEYAVDESQSNIF